MTTSCKLKLYMEDRQLKLMPASGTLAQLYRTIDVLCLKLQEYILDLAVN